MELISYRNIKLSFLLVLVMSATYPVAHQFSGVLGFSLQVHADGFFKPKVIKVLVNLVESGSQAETAGLALGDELIRVQDLSLPGTDTVFLKPHMEFLKDLWQFMKQRNGGVRGILEQFGELNCIIGV